MVVVTTQTSSRASHVPYLRSLIADMDYSRLNSSANLHSDSGPMFWRHREILPVMSVSPDCLRRGVSPR